MGLIILVLVSSLQSCSNEDNNTISDSPQKEITSINIEKKWIIAHFSFSENCKANDRDQYQKSALEITLKANNYKGIDKYSLKEYQGKFKLEGSLLSLTENNTDEVRKFKIIELLGNEMKLEALNNENILEIELVSFE